MNQQERQLLVGSWVNLVVNVGATVAGGFELPVTPFLAAAPLLQILVTRATDMYKGDSAKPKRAITFSNQIVPVSYSRATGVNADLTSIVARNPYGVQQISGLTSQFAMGGSKLKASDPVVLVLNGEFSETGLILPARYGERFNLAVPRSMYSLSAFAIDPRGSPKIDPVSAIGGTSVESKTSTNLDLRLMPKLDALSRADLSILSKVGMAQAKRCQACGQPIFISVNNFCLSCGSSSGWDTTIFSSSGKLTRGVAPYRQPVRRRQLSSWERLRKAIGDAVDNAVLSLLPDPPAVSPQPAVNPQRAKFSYEFSQSSTLRLPRCTNCGRLNFVGPWCTACFTPNGLPATIAGPSNWLRSSDA